MANEYYNETGAPARSSSGDSSTMRSEFEAIGNGFDKLPTLAGNNSEVVVVNAGASGMETKSASELTTLLGAEESANKNVSGGYVGLTNLNINFQNVAGTFTSYLTNSNTASRTYTFPDSSGTIALITDIHSESHTITSHTDTSATGSQLNTLTDGSNAGSLHSHDVASLNDTVAIGSQLDTLTQGSNADSLHSHTAAATGLDSLVSIGNAGTSLDLDCSAYDTHLFTCDQSTLTLTATDLVVGRTVTLVITNGGGCTITWPTGTDWPGGSAPALQTTGVDQIILKKITSAPLILAAAAGLAYA